jgi:hypothetical protein
LLGRSFAACQSANLAQTAVPCVALVRSAAFETVAEGIDNAEICLRRWARAGFDAWALGIEAWTVMGLRVAKVALGGKAAEDEMRLMVTEKLRATAELTAAAMLGQLGSSPLMGTKKVVRHYRAKVASNRRRLK